MFRKPVKVAGNIEDWLMDVLVEMQRTMKVRLEEAAVELSVVGNDMLALKKFNDAVCAQYSLLGIQMMWTTDVDAALAVCKKDKNSIKIAKIAKNSWKISVDLADNKSGMMVEILIGEMVGKKVVYKKVATGTLSSTATLTRSVKAKLSTGSMIKVVSEGKSLFTRTL